MDELSSFVGLAVSTVQDEDLSQDLVWVQEKLFTVGAILAFPGRSDSGLGEVTAADVERLERGIDAMSAELPGLEGFILPGGTQRRCCTVRSISRRAERMVSRLNQEDYPAGKAILPFLNRLSDYLLRCPPGQSQAGKRRRFGWWYEK